MSAAEPTPVPDADEAGRAAAVAGVARGLAAREGVALPRGLRLWALAGPAAVGPADPGPDADDIAGALGAALEGATGGARRRAQGLHVTPRWLAARLVDRVLTGAGVRGASVCDPACGGGAFLVAAAERLHRAGVDRREVVRRHLWGADIDPVGLAAAEAALALWAGEAPPPGRLVVGDPLAAGRALWPDAPRAGFAAVVGNPPFQGQLGRATARSGPERAALRDRFGDAVRAYTDTAWLFLLLGCDLARPGGRVALVQPQSLVAARDAAAVRAAVDRRADLRELWVDEGRVFAASVRVCAPVLVLRDGDGSGAGADRWRDLWADALGLPALPPPGVGVLGDLAEVVSGFRDEYYGLAGVVRERAPGDTAATAAPLVTSGALGWARCGWGDAPVRYGKRAWRAPVVDLARLAAGDGTAAARRWVERTRAPKLVVANQTRVIEAAVDPDGAWVPSVPALAVVPRDPGDLWRLAAAVLAPAATAWLARRAAGTALTRRGLRVAAPDLAVLPLPADAAAWDDAAAAARVLAGDPGADPGPFLAAAGAAYRAPDLAGWWRDRQTTRPPPPRRG
ncbi:MAG TPA: N-6 DNA methylase [Acidimicrobiales bacterium]|nr:N-6 DNA methylase [Acidimicrobiales bacterium]